MDALLKMLDGKVDQAELFHLCSRTTPIEFRCGKLESIKSKQIEGVALRVIDNGRLGFATTTDVNDPSGLIDAAIAAAAFGEEVSFTFPSKRESKAPQVYDASVANVSEEALIEIGEEAIALIRTADSQAEINLSIAKSVEKVAIENTSGLKLEEERTTVFVSIEVEKVREGDIFLLSDETQVRHLEDLNPGKLVDRLEEQLRLGKTIVPAPSRKLPVVFTPNGAIALLLPLIVGFNGKSVYLGTSPLKGRIGDTVLDPRLSIADDGTLVKAPGSGAFDDEGTPTSSTALVTEGVLQGFLYDLRTAALAGAKPTGNGYKGGLFGGGGFRSLPGVGMSNVIVGKGATPQARIIAGIEEGLLVEAVLGLGQGNVASGEFSNNVAVAFKIEDGKIVGRVKNTMIAGNTYNLLKDHLIALSDSARWVHGTFNTPTIAVDAVSVVGQSN